MKNFFKTIQKGPYKGLSFMNFITYPDKLIPLLILFLFNTFLLITKATFLSSMVYWVFQTFFIALFLVILVLVLVKWKKLKNSK